MQTDLPTIPLDTRFGVATALTSAADALSAFAALTGLGDVQTFIGATPRAKAAIGGLTSGATESGSAPGTYVVTFQAAAVTAALEAYLGQSVWVITTSALAGVRVEKEYLVVAGQS